jgi:chromosome partition protein MukF
VSEPRPDLNALVATLSTRGVALELQTIDLCFAASLYLSADHASSPALSSFSEDQLADVFERVCAVIEPGAEVRRRATDAIRRLREQRMLARIDGSGVVRPGEFALTRLAAGILDFFLEQETLTRESLTLLTRTLLAGLSDLVVAARAAVSPEDWQSHVVGPLHVTVGDLVGGIQRRQRGFDVQQEQFQREIGALLRADWFGAVERCQTLLESTGHTLRELNQVLLRDTHLLTAALQEIQEFAAPASPRAEEAARGVMDQVDRIAAWGTARQRSWSEYYQYVHRFLRDVVRLDPSRVLTHRLRERLAGKSGAGFALVVAATEPFRLLADGFAHSAARPPVRRRRHDDELRLADEAPDDPQATLSTDVRAAVVAGARTLCEVTTELTAHLPAAERFVAAGRIAHVVAGVCRPNAEADRPWRRIEGDILIEEWTLPEPP